MASHSLRRAPGVNGYIFYGRFSDDDAVATALRFIEEIKFFGTGSGSKARSGWARAEELGLFNNTNFVRNGAFNATGRSDPIAADWSASGPVEALTVLGGQGMAALSGGKLWQRVEVRAGHCYLMYAKINVSRGLVTWSVGDVTRGIKSSGSVRPSQISEVVSDVVESKSGYLAVAFEVPEGDGFRVMNVVVAELPSADQLCSPSEDFRTARR